MSDSLFLVSGASEGGKAPKKWPITSNWQIECAAFWLLCIKEPSRRKCLEG